MQFVKGLNCSTLFVPDRVFWKDNAKEIILPTLTGQMGVLKNHIPLLTGLDTGRLNYLLNFYFKQF